MPRVPARRLVRRLSLEQLEGREVLSVTFVDSGQMFGDCETLFGDLDGDGDLDIVFTAVDREVGIFWNQGDL